MIVKDKAVIISKSDFQEKDVILSCLTSSHGTLSGLVKSGRTLKKFRSVIEVGNLVSLEHFSKEGGLGKFSLETAEPYAYNCINSHVKSLMIVSLCYLIKSISGDHIYNLDDVSIFDIVVNFLDQLEVSSSKKAVFNYIITIKKVIYYSGYGFDLSKCKASGLSDIDKLIYLSPNSLSAISEEPGYRYRDKLMRLPRFFITELIEDVSGVDDFCDAVTIIDFAVQKTFYDNFHRLISDDWSVCISKILRTAKSIIF